MEQVILVTKASSAVKNWHNWTSRFWDQHVVLHCTCHVIMLKLLFSYSISGSAMYTYYQSPFYHWSVRQDVLIPKLLLQQQMQADHALESFPPYSKSVSSDRGGFCTPQQYILVHTRTQIPCSILYLPTVAVHMYVYLVKSSIKPLWMHTYGTCSLATFVCVHIACVCVCACLQM